MKIDTMCAGFKLLWVPFTRSNVHCLPDYICDVAMLVIRKFVIEIVIGPVEQLALPET